MARNQEASAAGMLGIRVENIDCKRNNRAILSRISFVVDKGRGLLVQGPNGVGKSTLLECLAGIRAVSSGRINIDHEQVAYCGHAAALKPDLTVNENLRFWRSVFDVSTVTEGLEILGLWNIADLPARQLSAGQRCRVSLATMIGLGRAIWLLDEPYVFLDRDARKELRGRMSSHLREGGIVIMTTNDLIRYDSWQCLGLEFPVAGP